MLGGRSTWRDRSSNDIRTRAWRVLERRHLGCNTYGTHSVYFSASEGSQLL
jgi:hypothetical protein